MNVIYHVLVDECTHVNKLFKNTYPRKRTPRCFLHAYMHIQTQYLSEQNHEDTQKSLSQNEFKLLWFFIFSNSKISLAVIFFPSFATVDAFVKSRGNLSHFLHSGVKVVCYQPSCFSSVFLRSSLNLYMPMLYFNAGTM